jgi:uncharacterized protein (TIGR00251 family)
VTYYRLARRGFNPLLPFAAQIKIKAPPLDGKANKHIIAFLAREFKVSKSDVIIQKGELSQEKQILITHPKSIPTRLNITPYSAT